MASKTIDFLINVKGNASREVGKLSGAMGSMKTVAMGASAGIAAVGAAALAAGAAFVSLANEITNTVDEANTLGAATGLSAQTIQALGQAARSSGKELKDIVPTKLAKNMLAAADSGGAMAEAFSRAGVEFQDAAGNLRSADEVFSELIDGLARMENRTEAAGLAAQLLGKQGRELLTAFEDSSGLAGFVELTEKYGIRVGPEAVEATSRWQRSTANLSLAIDDAKQSLLDILGGTDTMSEWADNAAQNLVFLSRFIKGWAKDVIADFKSIFQYLRGEKGFEEVALQMMEDNMLTVLGEAARAAVEFRQLASGEGDFAFQGPTMGGAAAPPESKKPVKVKLDEPRLTEGLPDTAMAWVRIAEKQREIAQVQLDLQQAAEVNLQGLVSEIPVVGGLLMGLFEVALNMDRMLRDLFRSILNLPIRFANSIENTLIRVVPNFLAKLPELLWSLSVRMPAVIARGVLMAIPRMIEGIVRGFAKAIREVLSFLRGGEDRNILTGQEGKVLGTSFKGGDVSVFGIDLGRQKGGRKRRGIKGGFATGGFVPETGIYQLHAGERVVPSSGANTSAAGRAARGFMSGSPIMIGNAQITVNTNDARDLIRQLRRELGSLGSGASLDARTG